MNKVQEATLGASSRSYETAKENGRVFVIAIYTIFN